MFAETAFIMMLAEAVPELKNAMDVAQKERCQRGRKKRVAMDSIIQKKKECYVCHRQGELHCHHIFFGNSNRELSERYGMKVWLCPDHHNMSKKGVHFDRILDLNIKCDCQEAWIRSGKTEEEFRNIFGKWWTRDPRCQVTGI